MEFPDHVDELLAHERGEQRGAGVGERGEQVLGDAAELRVKLPRDHQGHEDGELAHGVEVREALPRREPAGDVARLRRTEPGRLELVAQVDRGRALSHGALPRRPDAGAGSVQARNRIRRTHSCEATPENQWIPAFAGMTTETPGMSFPRRRESRRPWLDTNALGCPQACGAASSSRIRSANSMSWMRCWRPENSSSPTFAWPRWWALSSAFTCPGCGDITRMRLPTMHASSMEWVTKEHREVGVLPELEQLLLHLAPGSARRAPRTARPSAGCRAPSPCRGRWPPAASCRRRACGGRCPRTDRASPCGCTAGRCRRPPRRSRTRPPLISAKVMFCRTVFQGRSWSNSWNTRTRSGPGSEMVRPLSRISPSTGWR